MYKILLSISFINILLLIAEVALGFAASKHDVRLMNYHALLGLFTALFFCLMHSICVFHLIGSGKDIKEASKILNEHSEIVEAVRIFKRQVAPWAYSSIFLIMAAAISGAGVHTMAFSAVVHKIIWITAILVNIYTFIVEYRAVKENLMLMYLVDMRLAELEGKDSK